MKNIIIALVVTGALVGGFLIYKNSQSAAVDTPPATTIPEDPTVETTTAEGAAPAPDQAVGSGANADAAAEPAEPPFVMPAIEESDDYLRGHLQGRDAVINEVLERDDLIRKVVAGVDLVSRDKNPIRLMRFLTPEGRMVVEKRDDKLYLSSKNFERFEPLVRSLESVEVSFLGSTYQRLSPLFVNAFNELGNENPDWNKTVVEALEKVAAMEAPGGDIEVSGSGKVFIFADANLERLPPVQKLLIRMGPDNALRLQKRIREFLPYAK